MTCYLYYCVSSLGAQQYNLRLTHSLCFAWSRRSNNFWRELGEGVWGRGYIQNTLVLVQTYCLAMVEVAKQQVCMCVSCMLERSNIIVAVPMQCCNYYTTVHVHVHVYKQFYIVNVYILSLFKCWCIFA